jgi:photosystem II stability/assembly factor-like uncharacterized protein
MKPFPIAALLCGFSSAVACGRWQPQAIRSDADFRGLCAVGPNVAWVSGTKGTFARTTDGGKTWAVGTVPDAANLDFRDVAAFSEDTAYRLSAGPGEESRIYKTTDGGKTWKLQERRAPGVLQRHRLLGRAARDRSQRPRERAVPPDRHRRRRHGVGPVAPEKPTSACMSPC